MSRRYAQLHPNRTSAAPARARVATRPAPLSALHVGLVALAILALLALPAFANAPSAEDKAAFVKAVEANDCKLDFSEVMAVVGPAGLDRDAARAIALSMVQAGEAEITADQVLKLKTGACS